MNFLKSTSQLCAFQFFPQFQGKFLEEEFVLTRKWKKGKEVVEQEVYLQFSGFQYLVLFKIYELNRVFLLFLDLKFILTNRIDSVRKFELIQIQGFFLLVTSFLYLFLGALTQPFLLNQFNKLSSKLFKYFIV